MTDRLPRGEYPRPDFYRASWMSLNGVWDFSLNENDYDRKIVVPYACESELSGIQDTDYHELARYRRTFVLPEEMKGKQILLHFGAVDYRCRVWLNSAFICEHVGGQSPFCVDITHALADGENTLEVRAEDEPTNLEIPRGKQHWERIPRGIFYTRTTGIWQSVWLEAVEKTHLRSCRITPLYDDKAVMFEYQLSTSEQAELEISVSFQGTQAGHVRVCPEGRKGSVSIGINQTVLQKWNYFEDLTWSPEKPRLFDVTYKVYQNQEETDCVHSYFGMRKVSIENGLFCLNNRPYYQKLVLDQGYWEPSLLTAPTDEDFIKDIEWTKQMGFNGVRKHQKAEDPRYLYHADRLGLLVWGEIGSAYVYSEEYAKNIYREWTDILERDYNHPCIVAWTPLNESWGVQEIKKDLRQQYHSQAMVAITKSLDSTRMVIDNDGWEHTRGDLLTIHDYSDSRTVLQDHLKDMESILNLRPGGRWLFADGWSYQGQPILLTEFGGVKYAPASKEEKSWGYCETENPQDYADKLKELIGAVQELPLIQGYCYTQLTDVETEQNGLLTYQREPKIPLEIICEIQSVKH